MLSHQVNTVLDNCIAQLKNMPSQVINMIRIVDFAVFQRIESAHTVLSDKERKMVTIVVAGKRHAQTQRIDLPFQAVSLSLRYGIAQPSGTRCPPAFSAIT